MGVVHDFRDNLVGGILLRNRIHYGGSVCKPFLSITRSELLVRGLSIREQHMCGITTMLMLSLAHVRQRNVKRMCKMHLGQIVLFMPSPYESAFKSDLGLSVSDKLLAQC
jgi:hypothetical protein